MCNAMGIIRHSDYCDNCKIDTPDEAIASSDNTLEEIKVRWNEKLLQPNINNFFSYHPTFNINELAVDSGFYAADNYKYLIENCNILPIIYLNPRNSNSGLPEPRINKDGIPLCPNNSI